MGVKPEVPSNQTLNYIGVALAAISGIFYLFVKSESKKPEEEQLLINTPPIAEITTENEITVVLTNSALASSFVDRLSPNAKRILGISLASFSGVLYAFTFTPALYVQDNYVNASSNALDYVFSLYTGIYISSVLYFTIYCIVKKNKPQVYPKVILPALVSGWKINLFQNILAQINS